jgi:uncharacterized metal-binding protein YceD (DUF177 family)
MNEFKHIVKIAQIAAASAEDGKGLIVQLQADEAERAALARRFDIPQINILSAQVTLRGGADKVVAEGRLRAELVQLCVVTLDPVTETYDEEFERRFLSTHVMPVQDSKADIIVDADEEVIDLLPGDEIDIGAVVAEEMALALNPYPRKAGAVFDANGKAGRETPARDNPFSVLRQLKEKG